MKYSYILFIFIGFYIFPANTAFAQLVSDNAFLQGKWLECAVAPNGSWGNTVPPPASYHIHPGGDGGYSDPVTGGAISVNTMDFNYDYQRNGFVAGTPPGFVPAEWGPYFMPGIPYDGWAMQVNGVRSDAWYNVDGFYNYPGGTLTGTVTGYQYVPATCAQGPSEAIGIWTGSAGPGGGLQITQENRIDTFASWDVVTIKFVNTSSSTMPGLYYWVSGDPDNDETDSLGTFPTNNHICYQDDALHRVEVNALPADIYHNTFSGLATKDCRAKAMIYTSWSPYPSFSHTPGQTLDQIYDGTAGSWLGPVYAFALGTTTIGEDIAYGLIYNLGDLAPGDSTSLSFAWIFNDSAAIDSAFPLPQIVTLGNAYSSVDTVTGCNLTGCGVVGNTFTADIINSVDKDWTLSKWNWAPATGLSATAGTHVVVDMGALTTAITYTITGTQDTTHGRCGTTQTFLLYVAPTCFFAESNGPCPGDTLKLSAHGSDTVGATYYWYGPGGFTSTLQDPTIAVISSTDTGLYHVVKTVSGGHDTATVHVLLAFYPVVTAGSSSPLCSGNTLSLTATIDSPAETFSWTGPNGFSSGLQNPSISGTPVKDSGIYKVYTNYLGCRDSSTVHVVVDSTPAVPTVGSNGPICTGATLLLTSGDATPGVTYSWVGPLFTSTLQNPSISPATIAAAGVYTVTARLGTCSSTGTITVVIEPLPAAPVLGSSSPVCSGNTLSLTATDVVTGSTFSWTGPNSFTSTLAGPAIAPATTLASGTYSVIATFSGCSSPVSTETVVVDSTPLEPTISSNAPFCAGGNLLLTSGDGTTGVSYSWAGPPSFTSTLQNPTITGVPATASGVYTVTATLGICSSSDTLTVVINPIPTLPVLASLAPLCSGNALALTATDLPGCTYSWAGPNSFTSPLQNPIISPATLAATGTYSVVATLAGCTSPMATEFVVIDSTPVIPTFVSTNSPICSGDTLFLRASSPTAGITYSWTGPLSFLSPFQNTFISSAPAAATGVYTVTVTLGTCSSYTIAPVTVKPTPVLGAIGSNGPICTGNTLLLNCVFIPATGVFSWTGPNSFTSALQNPVVGTAIMSDAGTYYVSESLNGCNSDTSAIVVVVDSTPVAPAASSNSPGPPGGSICKGDTLKLMAADATAGVTYAWGGPLSFTSSAQNPFIANTTLGYNGIYTVTATLGACSAFTAINVVITPRPSLIATSNSPVCSGTHDTLFLQAVSGPGATFVWSGPYTFSSASQYPTRNPVKIEYAGVYQVTAYLDGCYSTINDTVTIRQTPAPPVVPWLTYCQNFDAPPLQAMGDSIAWYPTSAAGAIGSAIAPVPPTASDTVMWFYMTQTVEACMSALDSMKITVNPKPTVTVTSDMVLCPSDTAILTAVDTDPIAYYHWFPGLYLSDTSGAVVISRPENDMHYTVVASNQFGCSDTAQVTLKVNSGAVLYLGDSVTLYPGQTYQISPSTNCTSFAWFPASGLSDAYISNPVASPALSTKYIVHGTTSWGCTAEDSIEIYVSDETLLALPNAFTPGSGSPNSAFRIIKEGIATLQYFRIFDRWGVKVFETSDIDAGWDGSYNGTPQPLGVYVYQVSAVTNTGRAFEKHGNVTLIR